MPIKPSCDGKIRHKSLLSVEYHLEHKSQNVNDDYYKCKICQCWHIGTSGEKIRRITHEKHDKHYEPPKIRKMKL